MGHFVSDKDSIEEMWEKFLHKLDICVNKFVQCEQQKPPAHSKKRTYPKHIKNVNMETKFIA